MRACGGPARDRGTGQGLQCVGYSKHKQIVGLVGVEMGRVAGKESREWNTGQPVEPPNRI